MLQPVIIAGGSGIRVWPLSRKHYPKQFLPLINDKTLLQMAVERLYGLDCLPPIIVRHEEYRFIAAEQLRALDIDRGGIILEPSARNTAPATGLAALLANENNPQNQLLILPADHYMSAPEKFCKTVINAQAAAEAGAIVTFGIEPSKPATGYGYIKMTETENSPYPINQFIEKPCAQAAQEYLSSGQYLWNSGIFLCSSGVYLSELEHFRPDIFSACVSAWDQRSTDGDFIRPDSAGFEACPEESIDYALMEHTDKAVVSPMDPQWTDLGSWRSLLEQHPKTAPGNVETGDVLCQDSSNNYVYAQHKLVSLLGVDNLLVVDTQDALLVDHKDRVEDVKLIVQTLDRDQRSENLHHREVYRPWGIYNAMDTDERFQVKRISVKPMAKLSLQMHHHRAEHWVMVKGTAKVTIDGVDSLVSENESVYIPIGAVHSLENPGKIPIELIEIQTGSSIGEDDIVRIEDHYGRA